ncbi:DUF5803 family protein [Halobacterium jilantaiense]|uniref:Lipoprotein n=1 Tax=Halobacterium jilantaiense TaxID=355548 RepID=A0A1I0N8F9_9EURY|nr:DUF5803 family protein [Halobacterium jilantaiense]SEV97119.1 hypothetical protein SAMN04487945_0663 [Halobacterium jilantaiense]
MRKVWVALAVVALAVSAGCLGAGGGGGPSDERLAENATYEWNQTVDVHVNVTDGQYAVVAGVDNKSKVRFTRRGGFGGRNPLPISAVQFRYPNGTVVDSEDIDVSTKDARTVVTFPQDNGTFAYTSPAGSRKATVQVGFEGSHELVLPPGMRVSFPVLGYVEPGGFEKSVEDNRVNVRWESVDARSIDTRYYLDRDLLLFGGAAAVLGLVAVLGVVYYRLRIRRLEDEREDAGLDLEK